MKTIKKHFNAGKSNPMYKHGKCTGQKHCPGCNKKISHRANTCIKCFGELIKGKNHPGYKEGLSIKDYYCIDCGNELKGNNAYKAKRCAECLYKHRQGSNHPNWRGGKSFEPYSIAWTKKFKELIRTRDNHECQLCYKPEVFCGKKLDIHHIDYDKLNLNEENLISLCHSCHMRTNFNRDYWIKTLNDTRTLKVRRI